MTIATTMHVVSPYQAPARSATRKAQHPTHPVVPVAHDNDFKIEPDTPEVSAPVETAAVAAPQPAPTPTPVAPAATATPSAESSAQIALVDEVSGEVKVLRAHELQAIAQLLQPTQNAEEEPVARSATTPLTPVQPTPQAAAPVQTAAVATPEPAYSCYDALKLIAARSTVYFGSGGATLDRTALNQIREVALAVNYCPEARIKVRGHSDASGDDTTNLNLSWQRADAVVDAIVAMGYDTTRISPVGFGARLPSAQGDASGENDRRVEFEVLPAR